MGERRSHPPGAFSWTDLGTSDADRAKAFYTALFGWEADDAPLPEGGVYTMLKMRGKSVAALYDAQEGQPTAWMSYVTVDSADDVAGAAKRHGAMVEAEPFDVLDVGRMAVIADPTGAFFAIWEPRTSIGAELVNEPGALTINQLNTDDPERAQQFYADVFGWRFEAVEGGDVPYWGVYNGDRLNGGMMPLPADGGAPPHWLAYFGSESADDDAGRIGELGGTVVVAPMSVPGGRILVAADPQGGVFALVDGRFDD
jgi:predicted enzyme related to lactoylglutathione lyase